MDTFNILRDILTFYLYCMLLKKQQYYVIYWQFGTIILVIVK